MCNSNVETIEIENQVIFVSILSSEYFNLIFQYCTASSPGQFSKTNMTETLTTENSQCGPYPIVPCLKDIGQS